VGLGWFWFWGLVAVVGWGLEEAWAVLLPTGADEAWGLVED